MKQSGALGDFLKLEFHSGSAVVSPASTRVEDPSMMARAKAKKASPKKTAAPKKVAVAGMRFGKADLENLAAEQNFELGYWDPLKLADAEFWGQSNEATIGFLR